MLPIAHAIYGFFFSILIYYFFPSLGLFGISIIFLSSVLIDADHYLYYIVRKKDFNLIRAYNYFVKVGTKHAKMPKHKRRKVRLPFCIFHGIEVLIILLILSNYFPMLFFVFLGFSIHFFLDLIYAIYFETEFHKFSLTYEFIRARKLIHIENA